MDTYSRSSLFVAEGCAHDRVSGGISGKEIPNGIQGGPGSWVYGLTAEEGDSICQQLSIGGQVHCQLGVIPGQLTASSRN